MACPPQPPWPALRVPPGEWRAGRAGLPPRRPGVRACRVSVDLAEGMGSREAAGAGGRCRGLCRSTCGRPRGPHGALGPGPQAALLSGVGGWRGAGSEARFVSQEHPRFHVRFHFVSLT